MKHRLDELFDTIQGKKTANPKISYTAKLLKSGTGTIAQKVGEEAVETIIEAVSGRQKQLVNESVDLLYHLMVLWVDRDIKLQNIWDEIDRRASKSGIEEKANRVEKIKKGKIDSNDL